MQKLLCFQSVESRWRCLNWIKILLLSLFMPINDKPTKKAFFLRHINQYQFFYYNEL